MINIDYFSMFTGIGGFELGLEENNVIQNKKSSERQRITNLTISNVSWKYNTFDNQRTYIGEKSEQKECRQGRERIADEQREGVLSRQNTTFRCVGFSEIDKYCCQVLAKKFPDIRNYGDATKIDATELPDFDMLVGGFPCQSFSIAGKRRGFDDTRGTLFFEIARIIKVKRPKIVLLENVKGLLNHNEGKTFSIILQTLSELGYGVQWMVLNSKFFGVPQNRERVFIVGSLGNESRPEILPLRTSDSTIDELQGQKTGSITARRGTAKSDGDYIVESNGEAQIKMIHKHDREIARIYLPEGISPNLHLKMGGWQEPKIGVMLRDGRDNRSCLRGGRTPEVGFKGLSIRRLTPTECERLQGFPDNWTKFGMDKKGNKVEISDTQRYKMLGNAVTVNVIRAISINLEKML